ncbi:MAG: glutaredoxin [Myxococcota bacterium]
MTHERPLLPAQARTAEVNEEIASFHADFVQEVVDAVARHEVVIVGMDQNPVVKRARRLLDQAAIPYRYVGHGNYLTGYRRRLAVKLWSGYPTFPQVFVQGILIGGCRELERDLANGALQTRRAQGRLPPNTGVRSDGG